MNPAEPVKPIEPVGPVEPGQRFGKLTVVRRAGSRDGHPAWLCLCDCDVLVEVRQSNLRSGNTRSCGCGRGRRNHGGCRSATYQSWRAMRRRCNDPKFAGYRNYGGRGIHVDPQWDDPLTGYQAFVEDVGRRPAGTTLDRIDPDGHYEPGNVRWADNGTQAANRRRAIADRMESEEYEWWADQERRWLESR